MTDAIAVLNAGSSSLKFSLFTARIFRDLFHGQFEGLGASPHLVVKNRAGEVVLERRWDDGAHFDHEAALSHLMEVLPAFLHRIKVVAVGHRIVHGGVAFHEPVVLTPAVVDELAKLIPLAPLHQPHNIAAIRALAEVAPALPQVACFDTGFHRTTGPVEQMFALPWDAWERGLRRYGFHGLSYEYMSLALAERHGNAAHGRTIVAHLGSGASLCAMQGLQSVATSMGFSALDGLMMGTRCGALDPGALLYLMEIEKLSLQEVGQLLYHGSGLLGLSGVSSDPRVLLDEEVDNVRVQAALSLYVRRIVREIGALVAVLGGLDMLVFTAGIGEHNAVLRQRVCNQLEWLGVQVDATRNARHEAVISSTASTVTVGVERTNEEWIAAWHAARLLGPAA